jgi:hypothetical protein
VTVPSRRRRGAPRLSPIALAMSLLAAVTTLVGSASPADAYCTLTDEYTRSISIYWGQEEGYGDPQCGHAGWAYPYGNDGHYRGRVRDVYTDGSCVSVRYADGSYYGVQASSCDSAGVVYHFYDQNGDYAAYVRIERSSGASSWYLSNGY